VYRQPFEVTLRSLLALEDMERIDRLVQKGERIEQGFIFNAAQGGEKGKVHPLERINRDYLAELRREPYARTRGGLTEREREALAGIFTQLGKQRTPTPES
jgi:hypothetical protein